MTSLYESFLLFREIREELHEFQLFMMTFFLISASDPTGILLIGAAPSSGMERKRQAYRKEVLGFIYFYMMEFPAERYKGAGGAIKA